MLSILAKKLYQFATDEKRVNILRKFDKLLRVIGGKAYIKTLGQAKYHLRYSSIINNDAPAPVISKSWDCEKPIYQNYPPKISVLISYDPEETTAAEAVQIVSQQTYLKTEIKLLQQTSPNDYIQQLRQEISTSQGQLIWICNPQYCNDHTFLERMVSLFIYESVMAGIDDKLNFDDTYKQPYFMTAACFAENWLHRQEIAYSFNNVIFKKPTNIPDQYFELGKYRALLWLLAIAKGGTIGIYPANTRAAVQALFPQEQDFLEREKICRFITQNYKLDCNTLRNLKCINSLPRKVSPNIVMACYALKSGGGETYPIYLANEMKRQGLTVTILNFDLEKREETIVRLIDPDIPIINLRHTDDIGKVLKNINADIIHSHHATVDYSLALWLRKYPELGTHIITLHGMYEAIEDADCTRTINATMQSVYRYIYIADKNLDCFKKRGKYNSLLFKKMANGLPEQNVIPVKRSSMGIEESAFVLVLASRGIKEKGWKEAIDAVVLANKQSTRKIHLVILGDGEVRRKLEKKAYPNIHFTGTVTNVRDYFAMGDAGILPTRYKGESYPIAVMECLTVGKPVIATRLAEIPNQITDADGNEAGLLINLENRKINIHALCLAILSMANDAELYNQLKKNTSAAAQKFNMEKITKQYIKLYQEALGAKSAMANERSME